VKNKFFQLNTEGHLHLNGVSLRCPSDGEHTLPVLSPPAESGLRFSANIHIGGVPIGKSACDIISHYIEDHAAYTPQTALLFGGNCMHRNRVIAAHIRSSALAL